jgi:hypothetical protein
MLDLKEARCATHKHIEDVYNSFEGNLFQCINLAMCVYF